MPTTKTQIERNTFVAGIITEATPVNFPENASIDEQNFVLNRDGSRQRRLGFDMVVNDYDVTASTNEAMNVFEWKSAGGNGDIDINVVQIGDLLYFYKQSDGSTPPESMTKNPISFLNPNSLAISGTSVKGNFYFVCDQLVYSVTYDAKEDEFSLSDGEGLFVRDMYGVDDGLAVDERPAGLTAEHNYNLLNQGWEQGQIEKFHTEQGVYPSNADIASLGKKDSYEGAGGTTPDTYTIDDTGAPAGSILSSNGTTLTIPGEGVWSVVTGSSASVFGSDNNQTNASGSLSFQPFPLGQTDDSAPDYFTPDIITTDGETTDSSTGAFDSNLLLKVYSGTTLAPKGRYLLPLFGDRTAARQEAAGLDGLVKILTDEDVSEGRLSSVCGYAGRLFYSVADACSVGTSEFNAEYTGTVLFSQYLYNKNRAHLCHQEADPTSESVSDLIATDGGTIEIIESGEIKKITPLYDGVLVLSTTGVWHITGPAGVFSATDLEVNNLSQEGVVTGVKGIVNHGGVVYYWGRRDIYSIFLDTHIRALKVEPIAAQKIHSLYTSLSTDNVIGNYDEDQETITWLHDHTESEVGELVLKIPHGAWTTNKIFMSTNRSFIDKVHTSHQSLYLVQLEDNIFFANKSRNDFKDWGIYDAYGYLLGGYEYFAETQRDKQIIYLTTHFFRTESGFDSDLNALTPSGCLLSTQWDYANSPNSGKWGTKFQAYRLLRNYTPSSSSDSFDYGWKIITNKHKVRGSGRAFSLLFETEPEKEAHLAGWALHSDGGSSV